MTASNGAHAATDACASTGLHSAGEADSSSNTGTRTSTRLEWIVREPPLAPGAVLGRGVVAAQLAQRVLGYSMDDLESIRAVGGDDWLIVIAPPQQLPWAEGAVYLGWESGVLVPTLLRPTLPMFLVARTLARQSGSPDERLRILMPDQVLAGPLPERRVDTIALERIAARAMTAEKIAEDTR